MDPIVIAGTGLAGITVARELRKLDKDAPLVLVTADDGAFYSKPMLSNALAAGKTAAQLATTPGAALAAQLGARLIAGTRIAAIDPAAHTLDTGSETLRYSSLVLALGADPIRLVLGGDAAEAVLSVNDLADYARFRATIDGARSVAILGAGLIGCEFANDLRSSGRAVAVIDIAAQPLGRLLPPQSGARLRAALAEAGVDWHLGTSVRAVRRDGAGLVLDLADGGHVAADAVLSAIGLAPRIGLAATAGLATGRGIRVDRWLRTSAPDIYALGDCAEVEGLVLPFVMPIMQAARALARSLAGTPTALAYPAMPVVVKTPALPVVVAPPPRPMPDGSWSETATPGGITARFHDAAGALQGFALLGDAVATRAALTKELPAWL